MLRTFGFVHKIRCSFMKKSALQHIPTINSAICFTIFFIYLPLIPTFSGVDKFVTSFDLKTRGGDQLRETEVILLIIRFSLVSNPFAMLNHSPSEPSPYSMSHARVFNQKVSVICGLLPGHALVHRIQEEWNNYEWGMGEERLTGRGVVFQGSFN